LRKSTASNSGTGAMLASLRSGVCARNVERKLVVKVVVMKFLFFFFLLLGFLSSSAFIRVLSVVFPFLPPPCSPSSFVTFSSLRVLRVLFLKRVHGE
jgi:hypothetical protein